MPAMPTTLTIEYSLVATERLAALEARIAALEAQPLTIKVEHYCPACLSSRVEQTIRRKGSQLLAEQIQGRA